MTVSKGDTYGRWTVLRSASGAKNRARCHCTCGVKRRVRISNLIQKTSRSCGCLIGDTHRTHGQSGSIEYHTWERMITRCYSHNNKVFKNYGGRGVNVTKVWRGPDGFAAFLSHVGLRPSPKHSLDRYPNTNGNYEPGNVRWATRTEQNQNTRRNILLTFRGEIRCVSEWARITGIGKKTISGRLDRGWTAREALTTKPIRTRDYARKER